MALRQATAAAGGFEDAVVSVLTTAAVELADNEALGFVRTHEPELLLPWLTFEHGDVFRREASARLAPALHRFLPAEESLRATEWLVRLFLAYVWAPGAPVSLTDADEVRELVHQFVMPGLRARAPEVSESTRG